MARNSRDKIAKRRSKSRKKRLKLSVKIFLACFCFVALCGGYVGYKYYKFKNAPNPYGEMSDVHTRQDNTYEITDTLMEDAKYWVLDVGEGESIYIKSGSTDILVDTGSKEDGKAIIEAIEKELDGGLDYLILTSPSSRRIGGVKAIYDKFKPEHIIACDLGDASPTVKKAVQGTMIEKGESKTITLSKNSSFTIFKPEVSSSDPLDQSRSSPNQMPERKKNREFLAR